MWHRREALSALGRAGDARDSAEQALAIAEAVGHRGWTATALRAHGIAHETDGELGGAEEAFRRALDASDHLSLFTRLCDSAVAVGGAGPTRSIGSRNVATRRRVA